LWLTSGCDPKIGFQSLVGILEALVGILKSLVGKLHLLVGIGCDPRSKPKEPGDWHINKKPRRSQ